jgi:hypothetical protein
MDSPTKFSTNKNSKAHQLILQRKAREIFKVISKTLNTGNIVKIKGLNDIIKLFKKEWKIKDQTHEIILNFILEKLKNNKEDDNITEDEFIDLVTGNKVKSILFDYNLDDKRKQIEGITILYNMMGGDEKGLSAEALKKNLQVFMEFISDVDGYVENENSLYAKNNFNSEVEEILKLLATKHDDYLSLEDFINVLSEETYTTFENFALDPI